MAAIFDAYLADLDLDRKPSAPITRQYWKALQPHFGHLSPDMIDKACCQAYAAARRRTGHKDGTIITELTRLRSALSFAVKTKLLPHAPHIWTPPAPRPRDRWLTEEEAQRLLAGAVMPHMRLFIILALATAARSRALLELTWDRVDFDAGLIHLDNPDRERTKKGRATIPMNPMARAALAEAREGALTPYVIEYAGAPVHSVKKGIHAAAERAKLEGVSAHVLRHTAATWMAQAGVEMRKISLYLGHSNTRTTERTYAKHAPDYLADAAAAVNLKLVSKKAG